MRINTKTLCSYNDISNYNYAIIKQEMKRSDAEGREIGLGMESIERLEEHKRLMERIPEIQLTEGTKKLRQACFKASYKKRKRMALAASQ